MTAMIGDVLERFGAVSSAMTVPVALEGGASVCDWLSSLRMGDGEGDGLEGEVLACARRILS